MPAGADDPRQVVAVIEAAGVHGRTGIAQQQCSDVTFPLGLPDGFVDVDGTARSETDVTVCIDQPRDDPAAVKDILRVGNRLGRQHPTVYPPLHGFAVG